MAKERCGATGKIGAAIVEEAAETIVAKLQPTVHTTALAVSDKALSVSQGYSGARSGEESRVPSGGRLVGKFDGALRGAMSGAGETSSRTGDGGYRVVRIENWLELWSIVEWRERL